MSQYRIIKIEDRRKTYYRIEKKFLIWWLSARITEMYFEYNRMALITDRRYDYFSLEQAQNILNKIKNPYVEIYKGNKITRIFGDVIDGLSKRRLGDIYINKNHTGSWKGSCTYEFSDTISGLKEIIDNRTYKRKTTIIA